MKINYNENKLERFIPITFIELQEEIKNLQIIDTILLDEFSNSLRAYYHKEFHNELLKIKTNYHPFNPDRDTITLKNFSSKELKIKIKPIDPTDYIYRFANLLHLRQETLELALDLLKKAQEKKLVAGRSATGIAAAILYIASELTKERKTQKEIAEVAGVTEVTIRNRYRELVRELGLEDKLEKEEEEDWDEEE